MSIPFADAAKQDSLTEAQAKYFHDKGFLVVKNILSAEELDVLRKETFDIIQQRNVGPDYWYNDEIPGDWYNNYKESGHNSTQENNTPKETNNARDSHENNNTEKSQENNNPEILQDNITKDKQAIATEERKRGVPFRVEYVVDKMESCKHLIAHPFLLKAIAQIQGPDFLPTWDSMVFKYEGDGVPIKWHRDASADSIGGGFYNYGSKQTKKGTYPPPIDAGIYLDPANKKLGNCLYAIPGSHFWDDQLASSMISHFTANGFRTIGAEAIEVEPGDMIMHNILILHGSSSCNSPLRRTVYYEFRASEAELNLGPHIPEYIPLKQKMLAECIRTRHERYPNEKPFEYKYPPAGPLDTFRFSHDDYFSKSYKG
eukprot:Phypoly_transcript_11146.p1 GENE.Phypoly_transcript_11146~~Phypoly_transcript_11146.p1  ORF type:complete len:372 (+),score=62.76 Phypoly_transcript_11146:84-1199(+)